MRQSLGWDDTNQIKNQIKSKIKSFSDHLEVGLQPHRLIKIVNLYSNDADVVICYFSLEFFFK